MNIKKYLQTTGSHMGTNMACQYANIFINCPEEEFLENCTIKPTLSLRFII